MTTPDLFPALKSVQELQFARFHRESLVFSPGAMIRATELLDIYMRWAVANQGPGLGFKDLKRHMAKLGHRQRYSNGSYYLDCQLREAGTGNPAIIPERQTATKCQLDLLQSLIKAVNDLAESMT